MPRVAGPSLIGRENRAAFALVGPSQLKDGGCFQMLSKRPFSLGTKTLSESHRPSARPGHTSAVRNRAQSARQKPRGTRPATARILRGAASHIAPADTALTAIATQNAST